MEKKLIHSLTCMLVCIIALFLVVGVFASGCEPGGFPIVVNQQNKDLRIYIIDVYENGTLGEPRDYGIVLAKTTRELAGIVFAERDWVYRIQAKDPLGTIVFSHDYNLDDLKKIKWKVTIPP